MYEGVDTLVLEGELALEDQLPVSCRLLPAPPSDAALLRIGEANSKMLLAVLAFDEQTPEKTEERAAQSVDLIRLETKVNLLLDMVGRLLAQDSPRPRLTHIRCNARGARVSPECIVEGNPYADAQVALEIHLHASIPDPLKLFGTVSKITSSAIDIRFTPTAEATTDLINKFVFRRHRRRIADARHPKRQ